MFQYQAPVFERKTLLTKEMLDELRDYPQAIHRLLFTGSGNGVLRGTRLTWEKQVLEVGPGLLLYEGNIYRMESACRLACPPTDKLTYLRVSFLALDKKKKGSGGQGQLCLGEKPIEKNELELGRFRLQKGARLRTSYENVEDYQTEFDTMNRIHVPFICPGGTGLWPQLLLDYARELLATGTEKPQDLCFAMQLLGTQGQVTGELVNWYIEQSLGEGAGGNAQKLWKGMSERWGDGGSQERMYQSLLQILKDRRNGAAGRRVQKDNGGQMILL